MSETKPRLAIVGCGAVVERSHLPALKKLGWQPSLLVDRDLPRAQAVARRFKARAAEALADDLLGSMDAAIVAVPHTAHAAVAVPLLQRGIHVLLEKPMALRSEDCRRIIEARDAGAARLAVGVVRRFLHNVAWGKALIDSGALGRIEGFDIQEGNVFQWPVTSPAFWDFERAGGGVLADMGAYDFDLLLHLLGPVEALAYRDDNHGGVEADCLIDITLASGVSGTMELSRTRQLRNTAIVHGTDGRLELQLNDNGVVTEPEGLLDHAFHGLTGRTLPPQRGPDRFALELEDWLRAIADGRAPRVSGEDGAAAVALIERCYRERRPWALPWVEVA